MFRVGVTSTQSYLRVLTVKSVSVVTGGLELYIVSPVKEEILKFERVMMEL